jgi:hypothetical protein
VSASFVSWPSSGLELDFSFTLELEDTHMSPEQERLDTLLMQMVELIAKAEDEGLVDPYLTFTIAPDGCKVVRAWREDSESGSLQPCQPEVVFDNTLGVHHGQL